MEHILDFSTRYVCVRRLNMMNAYLYLAYVTRMTHNNELFQKSIHNNNNNNNNNNNDDDDDNNNNNNNNKNNNNNNDSNNKGAQIKFNACKILTK